MKWFGYNSLSALVSVIKSKFALKEHFHSFGDFTDTLPIAKGGTGATTRSDAFQNLSFKNYTCTKLSAEKGYYTDLDDLTNAGNYYVKSNSVNYSILSISEKIVNGWLMVIPSGSTQIKQIFYRYGSVAGNNDHQTYIRTYFSTGWTEWARLYDSKDIIPIENGGTGASDASTARTQLGITSEIESKLSKTDTFTPAALNDSNVTECHIYKKAGWVHVTGYVVITPTNESATTFHVAQLPQECHPIETARGMSYRQVSGIIFHPIEVYKSGRLQIANVVAEKGADGAFKTQTFFFAIAYPSKN